MEQQGEIALMRGTKGIEAVFAAHPPQRELTAGT
jgi:hypothetical protein